MLVLAEDDDTYEPNDGTYSLAAGECPPTKKSAQYCGLFVLLKRY